MPRKRRRGPAFSLRGVMFVPTPGHPIVLHAADPDAAQRVLAGHTGIVLANPPGRRSTPDP